MHTTRFSDCAINTPAEMITATRQAGYDAVYLTEHNAVWPEEDLADLRGVAQGMRVFGGVERSLGDGSVHILVLGTSDPLVLEIQDIGVLLDFARDADCLTVLAHPYRWPGGDLPITEGLLPDAIEYRTPNHTPQQAASAYLAAQQLHLRPVNASDAHSIDYVGRYWIETVAPLVEPKDLRQIVLAGAYENRTP